MRGVDQLAVSHPSGMYMNCGWSNREQKLMFGTDIYNIRSSNIKLQEIKINDI